MVGSSLLWYMYVEADTTERLELDDSVSKMNLNWIYGYCCTIRPVQAKRKRKQFEFLACRSNYLVLLEVAFQKTGFCSMYLFHSFLGSTWRLSKNLLPTFFLLLVHQFSFFLHCVVYSWNLFYFLNLYKVIFFVIYFTFYSSWITGKGITLHCKWSSSKKNPWNWSLSFVGINIIVSS